MAEQRASLVQGNKQGFINPFTDFSFKHLFGREVTKAQLIDFLNGIFEGRKEIADLKYGNGENKGPGKDYRKTIFDLYCTGKDGEHFIVEMQKSNPDNFKDRSVFYTSALIQEQGIGVEANWNYLLPEIYFIAIMNFKFNDTHSDRYIHDVKLIEVNTNTVFYQKLNYIFIEMPKFNRKEGELKTRQDEWLFILKNLKSLKEIPLSLSKKEQYIKFFDAAALGNLNPEEMNAYQQSLKIQRDNYAVQQAAIKEGHAKGLKMGKKEGKLEGKLEGLKEGKLEGLKEGKLEGKKEGLKEGKLEGKKEGKYEKTLEIASEMKLKGMDTDLISEITKLSKTEIDEIQLPG